MQISANEKRCFGKFFSSSLCIFFFFETSYTQTTEMIWSRCSLESFISFEAVSTCPDDIHSIWCSSWQSDTRISQFGAPIYVWKLFYFPLLTRNQFNYLESSRSRRNPRPISKRDPQWRVDFIRNFTISNTCLSFWPCLFCFN